MSGAGVIAPPRSIVVAQLAFIGDMVFTTPLLDALHQQWPGAAVVVVGRPRALEVLEDHPAATGLIAYDKDGADRGFSGAVRAAARVRERRPDLFLGVSRSARTAWLALTSGASRRVGFRGPGRRLAYNRVVDRDDAHRRFPERPLALLAGLGIEPTPRPLRLAVGECRRDQARSRLRAAGWDGRPLAGLAPGAHYATKRWPERHWAHLLDEILRDGRWQPALFGGPEEDALIGRLLAARPEALDRRGIGVRGVAAELACAGVFVGGDSGPAHIARALRTPAVVLFGPTDHRPLEDGRRFDALFRELSCRPCSPHGDPVCPLGHHACMEELAPADVLAAMRAAAAAARQD